MAVSGKAEVQKGEEWVALAVGDKVVLCGKLTKYKTTYETSSKKAYLYSLNGKTK